MAVALTGGNLAPKDAWKKIFYLPAGKAYSAAKVCIKINAMHTPYAGDAEICAHVCDKLNELGVPYGNITMFDSGGFTDRTAPSKKANFKAVNSAVNWDGDKSMVSVPAGSEKFGCYSKLGNGTYDMMVNFAPHKGHRSFGQLTAALKSIVGTWHHAPGTGSLKRGGSQPDANDHATPVYAMKVNKSDLMLNTHRLHIINSTRASVNNPNTNDKYPGILIMGTFAGAIDWLIADKIRRPLGLPTGPNPGGYKLHNQAPQQCEPEYYIEGFGYKTSDPRWINASDGVADAKRTMGRHANGLYQTAFSINQGPLIEIGCSGYHSGTIIDFHGRKIASFDGSGYKTYAVRDIMHKRGIKSARGTYFVRLNVGSQTYNEHVFIAH